MAGAGRASACSPAIATAGRGSPISYKNDDELNSAIRDLKPGSYEAARQRVSALVEKCGEKSVVGWLIDLRKSAKAALGERVPCDRSMVATWQLEAELEILQHGTVNELAALLKGYREHHGDYETPAGVELLPLDASVGLASSSAAFVLERTIRATRLPRQDALDVVVAGLLPNRRTAPPELRVRRYRLLKSALNRSGNRYVADLLGHALSYGEAIPPNAGTTAEALQVLPRAVRAYWMGEALLRSGLHAE